MNTNSSVTAPEWCTCDDADSTCDLDTVVQMLPGHPASPSPERGTLKALGLTKQSTEVFDYYGHTTEPTTEGVHVRIRANRSSSVIYLENAETGEYVTSFGAATRIWASK